MLALAKISRNDVAHRLIHNDIFPSWMKGDGAAGGGGEAMESWSAGVVEPERLRNAECGTRIGAEAGA